MEGCCECGNESSGSIKCGEFLLASDEGLCSMELVVTNSDVLLLSHALCSVFSRIVMNRDTPEHFACLPAADARHASNVA